MAKAPSFNFYSSDFLSQTMFLSFEDKGKLIMLLCLQHQHGHLKKEQMLKTCGTISDDLWEFFKLDADGKYFNEQIDIATEKRKNFINKQKNNISKRWNKVGNTKSIPNEYQKDNLVIPLEKENENEKEIEVEVIEEKKVVREKGNLPVKVKRKTPQAVMGEYFKNIYKKHTGQEYLAKAKDYTLLAELIHNYGENVVRQRIEWLEAGCVNRVFWFAKESGMNSFTIGKLYSQWNEILPQYTKEQLKQQEEKKKEEERMKRVLAEAQRLREERSK